MSIQLNCEAMRIAVHVTGTVVHDLGGVVLDLGSILCNTGVLVPDKCFVIRAWLVTVFVPPEWPSIREELAHPPPCSAEVPASPGPAKGKDS